MKKLIDSGPSERGFHRLETFLRCPTQYWWKYVHSKRPGAVPEAPADPLVRGSIFHVGLAHHYARMALAQRGDAETFARDFYTPEEAMAVVAERYGDQGKRLLAVVAKPFDLYTARYSHERVTIVGIEKPLEMTFEGFRYTARADLIVKDSKGKIWIWDHKLVGRVEDKVFRRYAISGQFHGLAHLGRNAFGPAFGGVLINVASVDGKLERRSPEPAPWLYRRWPKTVAMTERQIAALEDVNVEAWPAACSETVCVTPYGLCPFFEACRWGPSTEEA
jgi:hypothetical protein